MKKEIDQLVVQINTALSEESEPETQLDPFLKQVGYKGVSKAAALRNVLENIANDLQVPEKDRTYAREKLQTLAQF